MDLSPLYHGLMAIAFQIAFGLVTGDFITGAAAGMGFFFGREHAQAEERIIKSKYGGKRENMPFLGGFERSAWNVPSFLDMIVPVIMTAAVYFVVTYYKDFFNGLL